MTLVMHTNGGLIMRNGALSSGGAECCCVTPCCDPCKESCDALVVSTVDVDLDGFAVGTHCGAGCTTMNGLFTCGNLWESGEYCKWEHDLAGFPTVRRWVQVYWTLESGDYWLNVHVNFDVLCVSPLPSNPTFYALFKKNMGSELLRCDDIADAMDVPFDDVYLEPGTPGQACDFSAPPTCAVTFNF